MSFAVINGVVFVPALVVFALIVFGLVHYRRPKGSVIDPGNSWLAEVPSSMRVPRGWTGHLRVEPVDNATIRRDITRVRSSV